MAVWSIVDLPSVVGSRPEDEARITAQADRIGD